MSNYAPLPAEEYSDSDSDDFDFSPVVPAGTNTHSQGDYPVNSTTGRGGFPGARAMSTAGNEAKASKKTNPPKSKIPVSSPTNNGVNIEDFRLSIIRGSTDSTKKYIEQGIDVNITFRTGWTPLMYAAHQMNESLMTLLLSNGADPNLGSTTALMACCTSNVTNKEEEVEKCVKLLVSNGADVNVIDKYTMSPLMMAAKKGHIGAVKALLDAGADVNKAEKRGFTPLCWACSSGNVACVTALVQHGADVNVRTLQGQSPLNLAQSSSTFSQISKYLTSLPQFHSDSNGDAAALEVPSTSDLSNGPATNHAGTSATTTTSNIVTSAPLVLAESVSLPPGDPVAVEDARIDKVYNKFGDIEIFLYGLELPSLIPSFQAHDITMDHLLSITDEELVQVGVVSVGHRKLILDSVHELHKKDWKPASIPSYEKVKSQQQLSCAEVTTIIANIASHSACMNATIRYVTSQINRNPSLLQVDKNGRGVHALRRFLHEMEGNSNNQVLVCAQLKTEILTTLDSGAAVTNDHITRETTHTSSNRIILYSTAAFTFGVISLGVFALSKRFPSLWIPFSR